MCIIKTLKQVEYIQKCYDASLDEIKHDCLGNFQKWKYHKKLWWITMLL